MHIRWLYCPNECWVHVEDEGWEANQSGDRPAGTILKIDCATSLTRASLGDAIYEDMDCFKTASLTPTGGWRFLTRLTTQTLMIRPWRGIGLKIDQRMTIWMRVVKKTAEGKIGKREDWRSLVERKESNFDKEGRFIYDPSKYRQALLHYPWDRSVLGVRI